MSTQHTTAVAVLIWAVAVLAVSTAEAGTILFVDDDVLCGDGSSWENALDDLQRAFDIASETESVSEIRVAGGVYGPFRVGLRYAV